MSGGHQVKPKISNKAKRAATKPTIIRWSLGWQQRRTAGARKPASLRYDGRDDSNPVRRRCHSHRQLVVRRVGNSYTHVKELEQHNKALIAVFPTPHENPTIPGNEEVGTESKEPSAREDTVDSVGPPELLSLSTFSSSSSSPNQNDNYGKETSIHAILDRLFSWDRSFASLRGDPFDSLSVPLRKRDRKAALDFYMNYWSPSQTVGGHHFAKHNPFISAAFALAIKDAGLLHSILAFSSCVMSLLRGQQPLSNVYVDRGQAMKYLQERLKDPQKRADSSAILSVCFLMSSDLMRGQTDAARAHRAGLYRMVQSHPSFDDLEAGHGVRCVFITADAYYAWILSSPTFISPSTRPIVVRYPSHPFSPELCRSLTHCPEVLRELALQTRLNEELLGLLSRIARFFSLKRAIARRQIRPSNIQPSDYEFLKLYWLPEEEPRALAILDFFSSPAEKSNSDHDDDKNLTDDEDTNPTPNPDQAQLHNAHSIAFERCLSLSLLTLMRNARKRTRTGRPYALARQQLSTELLAYDLDAGSGANPEEWHCFVWMAVVAVESWRVAGSLPEEKDAEPNRLVARILEVDPKLAAWEGLRAVLERFLWDDELMGSWEIAWKGLVARLLGSG